MSLSATSSDARKNGPFSYCKVLLVKSGDHGSAKIDRSDNGAFVLINFLSILHCQLATLTRL